MPPISSLILYTFTFLSVYVQVFFLITFFENRKNIVHRNGPTKLERYPGVTIIVPCWNEELTIYKTVRSLLGMNYPKGKLNIFLVDDGSTDGTWNAIKKFEHYSNVTIFQKENGGKHTALNLGLKHLTTDFVGCLDADSVADKEAIPRIMSYFLKDASTMAVAPSVTVHRAESLVQNAQKAEYYMSVYTKKMLCFLGAIHVTPGPLTIFRKRVFDELGGYRKAHNTEDMEIAYRMQVHGYKIEHCNDAYVHTSTPPTIMKLYKQRLRWIYGFINNTIDYRSTVFRKRYGNFAMFTVPAGITSVFTASYFAGKILYTTGQFIYKKIAMYKLVGFHPTPFHFSFDFFFVNTQALIFLTIIIYSFIILSVLVGRKMAEGKWGMSPDFFLFLIVFSFVGPFWLVRALCNTIFSRAPAWR